MISIFIRDIKISLKDPIALWIGLTPIVLSLLITLLSPKLDMLNVNLVVYDTTGSDFIAQLREYATIETVDNREDLETRVLKRDEFIGIHKNPEGEELVLQGNETEQSLELAQILSALYTIDKLDKAMDTNNVTFINFQKTISPIKISLSSGLLLMITIVSSMLIAIGLVTEKSDKTIRAANVTPITQTTYILSKSIIGIINFIICSIICLLILGLNYINWIQMAVLLFSISLLSIIIAFAIGLTSKDFIEATGSLKVLMTPLLAGALVYELADKSWHWTVYWNPFYWNYKGIVEIINEESTWPSIILYAVITLFICTITYLVLSKFLRKNLN